MKISKWSSQNISEENFVKPNQSVIIVVETLEPRIVQPEDKYPCSLTTWLPKAMVLKTYRKPIRQRHCPFTESLRSSRE